MNKRQRAAKIVVILFAYYPEADCTLDFGDHFELLVGGILSAQCTDLRVNLILPGLFQSYPTLAAMAAAEPEDLWPLIRSCGLFRNKAKAIVGSARTLLQEHGGVVPADRESLLALPGVGRKIANLILGDAFGIPAVVVDTHCARISRRLGLTEARDPNAIERDLVELLPPEHQIGYGHRMVALGRDICLARSPQCARCPVRELCPSRQDDQD